MYPGFITGQVIDIAQTGANVDITVTPNGAAATIPALAAGQNLTLLSNAWAPGTGQPKGKIRDVQHFEFPLQIIKETISAEGSEMTNSDWFNVAEDGSAIPAYYNLGLLDGDFRQSLMESGALLFQNETTNTIVDPSGETTNEVETMIGLVPQMQTRSLSQSIAADTFSVDNLYDAELKMTSQHVYSNYVSLVAGIKRHHAIETALFDFFNDENIPYARRTMNEVLFDKNESLAATVNFKIMTVGQKTFCIKRMDELSNPEMYNFSDSQAAQLAFYFPLSPSKDGEGKLRDHFSIRYKKLGNYSRRREMWTYGAAGTDQKIGPLDTRDWYWRSHLGLQGFKLNQCILVTTP
jgi:hypothetical protein